MTPSHARDSEWMLRRASTLRNRARVLWIAAAVAYTGPIVVAIVDAPSPWPVIANIVPIVLLPIGAALWGRSIRAEVSGLAEDDSSQPRDDTKAHET